MMKEIWSRLSWPQVVVLVAMIAGAVVAFALVPLETWQGMPWEALASLAVVVLGGGASVTLPPILRSREDAAHREAIRRANEGGYRAPKDGTGNGRPGHVDVEILGLASLFALSLLAAVWSWVRSGGVIPILALALAAGASSGCSASALRSHRMALGLTDIALGAGHELLVTIGDEVIASCGEDEECLNERKGTIADAEAAFTFADAARGTYSTAIDVAREVGEGDFLSAVGMGARGLLRAYYYVRAALCRLGREIPEPPALLVQLVTWAAREPVGDVPSCVLATH